MIFCINYAKQGTRTLEMWYTPGTIMAVNVPRELKGDYGAV